MIFPPLGFNLVEKFSLRKMLKRSPAGTALSDSSRHMRVTEKGRDEVKEEEAFQAQYPSGCLKGVCLCILCGFCRSDYPRIAKRRWGVGLLGDSRHTAFLTLSLGYTHTHKHAGRQAGMCTEKVPALISGIPPA